MFRSHISLEQEYRLRIARSRCAGVNFTAMVSPARKQFALGLGIRLVGVLFLWLGDGSPLLWRKALVVVGVALSIGGIGILRWLLFQPTNPSPVAKAARSRSRMQRES